MLDRQVGHPGSHSPTITHNLTYGAVASPVALSHYDESKRALKQQLEGNQIWQEIRGPTPWKAATYSHDEKHRPCRARKYITLFPTRRGQAPTLDEDQGTTYL